MNMDLDAGMQLAEELKNRLEHHSYPCEVILAPPFIHLSAFKPLLQGTSIACAAQDCSAHSEGAYTGEVSAQMIRSCGCSHVIIGHSERRSGHHEDHELLARKTDQALAANLDVIFCVGEQQSDRESGNHYNVVDAQLRDSLAHLSLNQWQHIIIAYEPVWAIGTGLTATPEQAQEMHSHIRRTIASLSSEEQADATTILYGGSCKPDNAEALFCRPDVDGGLIGGAALKADTFISIIEANR